MPRGALSKQSLAPTQSVAARLLAWYDRHRRELPWRAPTGERADPYRVWLSEIMLQQTTVQAVAGYYRKFLARWPTVRDIADAPLDDVLAAWAGLGYYARARNLHKAAQVVARDLGGAFPDTMEGLRALPGVGAYTAGAIAAIAYDLPEAAMDANAERVVARLFAVEEPLPKAKERIRAFGQSLVPNRRAGDFAQAMMDLGSAICTPKRPGCMSCPLFDDCAARKLGIQEMLPVKGAKAVRPLKRGAAFVALDADGAVLLVRRPESGLLGGMMQPPLGPWTDEFPSTEEALAQAPFKARWRKQLGVVRHGFTHFELEIEVYSARVTAHPKAEGRWIKDWRDAALPTVMRKIVEAETDP
jgi:A/G-specific adenine glycosylase